MRNRFAKYVDTLKTYCEKIGISNILYVVNIHETGSGCGFTYPVGVSQLQETYKNDNRIVSGSDVYFGDVKIYSFQDSYLCNGITAATNRNGKPLGCVEFNTGDSNFGDDFNNRDMSSSNDFRTRIFIAQGNKLINYYLFCAGSNYRFDTAFGDGNDRIATTGENHGFAAPIGPTGIENYTFPKMRRVIRQIMVLEDKFAQSFIQYDNIAYGFIPDDYMTKYAYQKAEATKQMFQNIEMNRNSAWESTIRAFLLMDLKINTLDIQNMPISLSLSTLIISSSTYMSECLQQKLVNYLLGGGNLILNGRIPRYDDQARPCRILADLLETDNFNEVIGRYSYITALACTGLLEGLPEFNVAHYEDFDVKNAETLLYSYDSKKR